MKKQYLLGDEVIKLLKKEVLSHIPNNWEGRNFFRKLKKCYNLSIYDLGDPQTTILLLERCVDYLRGKGIYVFYRVNKESGYVSFIAGECGRLVEKLDWQATFIRNLIEFIEKRKHELPPDTISTKEALVNIYDNIKYRQLVFLLNAYEGISKRYIKLVCKWGWEFAEWVDAYLDSIKDLQRLFAISLIL
jgi:hypothetical protein